MRKLHKAAVVVAMLGSVGFIGSGTAFAGGGPEVDVHQTSMCKSHDLNLDVLGEVGILNGLLGNALNGEGQSGSQGTHLGSSQGCNESAF
ncbi:hypothetical protein [Streptomyces palmae]|uniref:Secreted protein n=1 Tax=Streptomyces palmae TaxID=1701085 RepID=A0A4Z0H7Q4_9ACTN|nr:hypothetical protein [Streptomyces palmae]TGB10463.1 hypothetical protein E4099_12790 [Streptomyces palmae]